MSTSLKTKILDISEKHGLTHIGSNLSCLPVLVEIYKQKKDYDKVILDNAHAHLAHLVVAEEYDHDSSGLIHYDAEGDLEKYGIHCDRRSCCDVSGGSLGHGLGIAIGLALIDRNRSIYVIVSDGSMMEGSNWEALRLIDSLQLKNIKIYANFNGYSAVAQVNLTDLVYRMREFNKDIQFRFTTNTKSYEGVKGHYLKNGKGL